MSAPNVQDPRIPTVGQAGRVIVWSPTTVFLCHCRVDGGNGTVLLLYGFQNFTICPHCRWLYCNESIERTVLPQADGQSVELFTMNVKRVPPTPAGSVM